MFFLLISLLVIMIVTYYLNMKEPCAPPFLFSLSFIFCAAWAFTYQNKWGTDLKTETIIVILGGVLTYCLSAINVKIFFYTGRLKRRRIGEVTPFRIRSYKLSLFLIIEIISVILYAYTLMKVTGITNIPNAIVAFRQDAVLGTGKYSLPRIVFFLRIISVAIGYWFTYVFANNILAHKINIRMILIIICSILSDIMAGGRAGAINQVFSLIGIYMVLKLRKVGVKHVLNIKQIMILVIALLIFLVTFQQFGTVLGREAKRNIGDYLAVYCGAPFHNLNDFIANRMGQPTGNVPGSQTFRYIIRIILKIRGEENFNYYFDLPYIESNGYFLGNVATTFYSLLYDFGYIGCFFLTAFMGGICQYIYEKAKYVKETGYCSYAILIFGYIFNSIVFGYFSNWFYEEVFNLQFIYNIIIWAFLNIFCFGKVGAIGTKVYGFRITNGYERKLD